MGHPKRLSVSQREFAIARYVAATNFPEVTCASSADIDRPIALRQSHRHSFDIPDSYHLLALSRCGRAGLGSGSARLTTAMADDGRAFPRARLARPMSVEWRCGGHDLFDVSVAQTLPPSSFPHSRSDTQADALSNGWDYQEKSTAAVAHSAQRENDAL
jgi:hypothetical protein